MSKAIQGVYDTKLANFLKKEKLSNVHLYEEDSLFIAAHSFLQVRVLPKTHYETYGFLKNSGKANHLIVGEAYKSLEPSNVGLYPTPWRYYEQTEKGTTVILRHLETRTTSKPYSFLIQQCLLDCFDLRSQSDLHLVLGKVFILEKRVTVIVLMLDTEPIGALSPRYFPSEKASLSRDKGTISPPKLSVQESLECSK